VFVSHKIYFFSVEEVLALLGCAPARGQLSPLPPLVTPLPLGLGRETDVRGQLCYIGGDAGGRASRGSALYAGVWPVTHNTAAVA